MALTPRTDALMRFPILIGDIGGTNTRFGLLVDANAQPKPFPILPTGSYPTIEAAIQSEVLDRTSVLPRSALLAVAGPVESDAIALTNSDWVLKPHDLCAALGLDDIVVLNDFEAQALAVAALDRGQMERIGGGEGEPRGSRVVLGPGTGLGVAGLINWRGTWIPVPGEGGHVDVGPRTARDQAIWPHLEAVEGRVSGEQLVSGRGLVNIYRACAAADGVAPVHSRPQDISAAALASADPLSVDALDLFVTYLGRIAGDVALTFMSRGGAYLTGGIVQKIVPALTTGAFRAAFEDKAPHAALLRAMPVHVVTNPSAALLGLSAYARMPARFGVSTQGRRWTGARVDG